MLQSVQQGVFIASSLAGLESREEVQKVSSSVFCHPHNKIFLYKILNLNMFAFQCNLYFPCIFASFQHKPLTEFNSIFVTYHFLICPLYNSILINYSRKSKREIFK